MSTPTAVPDTPVLVLHDLVIREEDGDHIVGRVASGVFVSLPPLGVQVIELIQEGLAPDDVRARLLATDGADVDVPAFVAELLACGFVAEVDGRPVDAATLAPPHLPRLRASHVRWLFTWPVALVWLGIVTTAVVTLVRRPEFVPTHGDFFWLPGTSLPLIAATVIACLTISAHELAHLAAARANDVPARISISTRLHHLVAQTDVSGAWAAPRRRRYVIYLAGIGTDLLVGALAVLVLANTAPPAAVASVLGVVVLTVTLGVAWQCEVYLRTDLYFVLQDLLRCRNLHHDARQYLRGRLSADLPAGEARRIRWYAWFMAAGTVVALTAFAAYTAPILVRLWTQAATSAWHGVTTGAAIPLLDGAATLAHQALLLALFVTGFRRGIDQRRRQW